MSWNQLTADTKQHKQLIRNMFAPLVKLEVLSLAYNRLGDEGASNLIDCVLARLHAMRVLDLSFCFLTNNCYKPIARLLSGVNVSLAPLKGKPAILAAKEAASNTLPPLNANSESKVSVVILQGTVLKPDVVGDLRQHAVSCGKKLVTHGLHIGIDVPIKYEALYSDYLEQPAEAREGGDPFAFTHKRFAGSSGRVLQAP